MKVSVVISIYNRTQLFRRGLYTLVKQSMDPQDYEIVLVDDGSTEDVLKELTFHQPRLNFQYIRIDHSLSHIPVFGHTPALSNNIGFRKALGKTIVISQPEILHDKNNLEYLHETAQRNFMVFGGIHHSSMRFVTELEDPPWIGQTYDQWIERPGARDYDTHDILHGHYWFVAALPKYYIELIGGIDEEYLRGVYGEDDNLRERIEMAGCPKTIDWRVRGIHQCHIDETYPQQQRNTDRWEKGAIINRERYANFKRFPRMMANEDHIWGDPKVIVQHLICHENYKKPQFVG